MQDSTKDKAVCNKTSVDNPYRLMSMTIPVWVSSNKEPDKQILTYANLDSGSDSCYITNEIANQLTCDKKPIKLPMSTMTHKNFHLDTVATDDLIIKGYNCHKNVRLPMVYATEQIPAKYESIPKADAVAQWPHLKEVTEHMTREADLSVGLLIGNNCPVAFKPREVRVGGDQDSEPFGLRSDLGWAIMGRLDTLDNQADANIVNKTIANPVDNNTQVTFKCQPETNTQINKIIDILSQDFKDFANNTDSPSIEDKRFLKIMHKETCMKDGHVTMPLPLKQKPPENNSFKMAQSRFRVLQNKLSKNETLSKQYHSS